MQRKEKGKLRNAIWSIRNPIEPLEKSPVADVDSLPLSLLPRRDLHLRRIFARDTHSKTRETRFARETREDAPSPHGFGHFRSVVGELSRVQIPFQQPGGLLRDVKSRDAVYSRGATREARCVDSRLLRHFYLYFDVFGTDFCVEVTHSIGDESRRDRRRGLVPSIQSKRKHICTSYFLKYSSGV